MRSVPSVQLRIALKGISAFAEVERVRGVRRPTTGIWGTLEVRG